MTDSTAMLRGCTEIADFTGLSRLQIMAYVADGELPHVMRDGRICADRHELLRWAQTRFGEK